MSKLETNIIAPSTGTTITIGESGDTVTLPSGVVMSGQNYPAFHIYETTDQTGLSDAVWTKANLTSTLFDTDSAVSNSIWTCPSGGAGKYFVYSSIRILAATATNYLGRAFSKILLNGSEIDRAALDIRDNPGYIYSAKTGSIMNIAVGDTLELQGLGDVISGTVTFASGQNNQYMGAFRIGA